MSMPPLADVKAAAERTGHYPITDDCETLRQFALAVLSTWGVIQSAQMTPDQRAALIADWERLHDGPRDLKDIRIIQVPDTHPHGPC